MKLKNFVRIMLIVTIMSIAWVVLTSTFVNNKLNRISITIDKLVHDLKENNTKINFSLKLMDNLSSDEYIQCYNDIIKYIKYEKEYLKGIAETYSSFDIAIFPKYQLLLNEFDLSLENYNKLLIKTDEELDTNLSNNILINNKEYKEEIINKLEYNANNLEVNFRNIKHALFEDINLITNYVYIVMIIIFLILCYIVYYIIPKDMDFIIKSFHKIDNRNYNIDDISKFKPIFEEEKTFRTLINRLFKEKKLSLDIKNILMKTYEMDELLEQLFKLIEVELQTDRIGIAFIDYINNKIIAEYGVTNYSGLYLNPGHEVDIKSTKLKNVIMEKKGYFSNDIELEYELKPNSETLDLLQQEGIKSNMIIPLLAGDEVFGLIFFSSLKKNNYSENHLHVAEKLIFEISGFLNRAYLTKVIFSKMTLSFSRLVEEKDNETGNHLCRMTAYSLAVVKGLREKNIVGYELNKKIELEINRYASIHDIGKVAIPDKILNKPGKLDKDEWEIMKTHVTVGRDIFVELRSGLHIFDENLFKVAEEIITFHHEKWDGTGYPYGLKGTEIPLVARIISIADVFDALTSKRTYKEAFSIEKAIDIIKESKGTHFDPIIVDIFIQQLNRIKEIHYTFS